MKKKPLISACYILRNGEDFLWYSIKSVWNYVDEFIFVDDGSTDATIKIIKSFPQDKITLVQGDYGQDKRKQRNEYLKRAKSEWVMVIDDDEVYASSPLEWLRKFIQSNDAVKYNEIFFKMLWFWKDGGHVVHGHHWDQKFETFFRNIPSLVYNIHHAVSLNGNLLCKSPGYSTDAVTIYHYSHCKPEEKVRNKIKYYMLRDNPNVNLKNVNLFVKRHPHFSGNFNQPRYGPEGLQIAGTVGSQVDVVVGYSGKHPEVMEGHPLIMKSKGTMEEYKSRIESYMVGVWQFHNHLHYPRHQARIQYTAEFCRGKTLDVGCANGFSTDTMIKHLKSLGITDVEFQGIEPTNWAFKKAVETYPNIKFHKTLGENLPFEDNSFDTILLSEVIEHCLNPDILVKELVRVSRDRIIISTPNGPHPDPDHVRAYSPLTLSKLMASYLSSPPKIYGLTESGERCYDLRTIYFMIAVGNKRN